MLGVGPSDQTKRFKLHRDLWLATLRERRLVDMASRTRGAVAWGHVIAGAAGFAAGLLASQLLECESKQKRGEALPDALKGLKLHICESLQLCVRHVISCDLMWH